MLSSYRFTCARYCLFSVMVFYRIVSIMKFHIPRSCQIIQISISKTRGERKRKITWWKIDVKLNQHMREAESCCSLKPNERKRQFNILGFFSSAQRMLMFSCQNTLTFFSPLDAIKSQLKTSDVFSAWLHYLLIKNININIWILSIA